MKTKIVIACCILSVVISGITHANTYLSEPDAIIYGTIRVGDPNRTPLTAEDKVIISARITISNKNTYELARYELGEDENAGDNYILRIPLMWDLNQEKIVFVYSEPNSFTGEYKTYSYGVEDTTIKLYAKRPEWEAMQPVYQVNDEQANLKLSDRGSLNPIELHLVLDSDKDGINDLYEQEWGLNPNSPDSDGDGIPDGEEVGFDNDKNHYNPYNPLNGNGTDLNANNKDTDQDGMSDGIEFNWNLNPVYPDDASEDQDGDGYLNREEVARDNDPNDCNDIPESIRIYVDAQIPYDSNSDVLVFDTIQAAVDYSITGDEIIIRDGIYYGPGNTNVEVVNRGKITIAADSNEFGPEHCIIDCNESGRAFFLFNDSDLRRDIVTISGLTIKNGFIDETSGGAAIYNSGAGLNLKNCLIAHNYTLGSGGGIFLTDYAWGYLENITISDNTAGTYGGAVYAEEGSQLELLNSILWNDIAILGGDEIYLQQATNIGSTLKLSYTDMIIDANTLFVGEYCDVNCIIETILQSDPLFAQPGYFNLDDNNTPAIPYDDTYVWIEGDYHLQSLSGRRDPIKKEWIVDSISSPCIDSGDQNSLFRNELDPNGLRINMGSYGGTIEASLSRSDN